MERARAGARLAVRAWLAPVVMILGLAAGGAKASRR